MCLKEVAASYLVATIDVVHAFKLSFLCSSVWQSKRGQQKHLIGRLNTSPTHVYP